MFIMQLRFSYSRDIFFYFELPERYCAHVHRLKIVDTGDNEEQSGALTQKQEMRHLNTRHLTPHLRASLLQPSQSEYDGSLVLLNNLSREKLKINY